MQMTVPKKTVVYTPAFSFLCLIFEIHVRLDTPKTYALRKITVLIR
jgi:hypothetical protein